MYIVKTLRQMQYLVRNGFDCKKIEKSLNGKLCFSKKKKLDWNNKLEELITKLDKIIE